MVLRFAFRPICVVLATGCASPHSEIHLGPLYSSHSIPGFSRTETAAGLIRKERFENATTWAVNPLFWRRTLDSGHQVTDFLYPLGRSTYDPVRPQTSTRILPFLWYDREMKANGIEEVDWFVFPFVGGSASDGSESSFGVFPFYGDLRGFMSWDRLEWILFPFWVRTSQSGRQHTNFLWPVFGKRSGAGSSGWHAFPFYGTNSLEGKYERRYILWPFWTEAKEKLWQSTPQKGWQLAFLRDRLAGRLQSAHSVVALHCLGAPPFHRILFMVGSALPAFRGRPARRPAFLDDLALVPFLSK
ncbi:MAG: hypothetical protein MK213_09295 [Planctomycetes bacterium]|nr:hypothetical protein [Planctomycetota bacterium]